MRVSFVKCAKALKVRAIVETTRSPALSGTLSRKRERGKILRATTVPSIHPQTGFTHQGQYFLYEVGQLVEIVDEGYSRAGKAGRMHPHHLIDDLPCRADEGIGAGPAGKALRMQAER